MVTCVCFMQSHLVKIKGYEIWEIFKSTLQYYCKFCSLLEQYVCCCWCICFLSPILSLWIFCSRGSYLCWEWELDYWLKLMFFCVLMGELNNFSFYFMFFAIFMDFIWWSASIFFLFPFLCSFDSLFIS